MQSIADFDAVFKNIAVPMVRDYSRLSSSPSRDVEDDSSYFQKSYPPVECDTPVKMRLPIKSEDVDSGITNTEIIVPSSDENLPTKKPREPLKIVPNDAVVDNKFINDMSRLAMFAPKAPEERLSQRRRSEQKKKEEEEKKNPSRSNSVNRGRSTSSVRETRAGSVTRIPSRANSVTRATTPTSSVVTRSMARAAATEKSKVAPNPPVRRSYMKAPVVSNKPTSTVSIPLNERSRDRTRRPNTTGGVANRRSCMPIRPVVGTTPKMSERRTTSLSRAEEKKERPIAVPTKSSTLRMSTNKAEAGGKKPAVSRPTDSTGPRGPIRVNPATPKAAPINKRLSTNDTEALFNRLSTPKVVTPVRSVKPQEGAKKSIVRPVPSFVRSFTKSGMPTSAGLHGLSSVSRQRSSSKN